MGELGDLFNEPVIEVGDIVKSTCNDIENYLVLKVIKKQIVIEGLESGFHYTMSADMFRVVQSIKSRLIEKVREMEYYKLPDEVSRKEVLKIIEEVFKND